MLWLVRWIVTTVAPIFIVVSPVTSYADQIWSIYKTRSSAGFSLDIPLIMLVASILKVFYWLGARYDFPLLIQASVMLLVQLLLLHIALLNRPPFGAQHSITQPFTSGSGAGAAALEAGLPLHPIGAGPNDDAASTYVTRPYSFWQWRSRRPYWQFISGYAAALVVLQLLVGWNAFYIGLQGYFALGVEAILPVPQILENRRNRSCKGFRMSVLANWLLGDVFKMSYFFMSEGGVPLAFKLCGFVQSGCDIYLGVQYWMYGSGEPVGTDEKAPRRN